MDSGVFTLVVVGFWLALVIWWISFRTRQESAPLFNWVHIILFKNSPKEKICKYKVVYLGQDITRDIATDFERSSGCGVTSHLTWEDKFQFGGSLRVKLKTEPWFWHKVYLDGGETNTSRGYGSIKTTWHNRSPKKIYEELLTETVPPAPARTQSSPDRQFTPRETPPPAANTHLDIGDLPIQANLCGHPKATVIFIESVGAKVQRGQIVMRFEVLSARLNNTLGLTEYAERQGILEPLVQVGDEILDKQAIYRIKAEGS